MNDEAQKFNVLKLIIQGKFIRINFDASGYIAGANIGKKWTFLWLGSFLRPLYSHLFFRDLLIGKSSNYQTGRGREILSHFLPTPDGSDQGVQMWVLWFYFPKLKQLQWLMQAWSFVMGHLWDLNCHSVRCGGGRAMWIHFCLVTIGIHLLLSSSPLASAVRRLQVL